MQIYVAKIGVERFGKFEMDGAGEMCVNYTIYTYNTGTRKVIGQKPK